MLSARSGVSLAVLLLITGTSLGQGLRPAIPGPARINPNGSYTGPDIRFAEALQPRPNGPGVGYYQTYFGWPIVPYYGGTAYGPGLSGLGPLALVSNYPGAGYGYTAPAQEVALRAEIAEADRRAREAAARAARQRATLTLELPALAEVRVKGQAGVISEKPVLTSDWLAPGSVATFDITATWTQDGQRYEWQRVITLPVGNEGRLLVVRGTAVQ